VQADISRFTKHTGTQKRQAWHSPSLPLFLGWLELFLIGAF
jgi:hypothetical protein